LKTNLDEASKRDDDDDDEDEDDGKENESIM
jgi:hypothetical protein